VTSRLAGRDGRAEPAVTYTTRKKPIRLSDIIVPPVNAKLREALDQDHVEQMVLALEREEELPPIKVALDSQGRCNLLDGAHRMAAHRKKGEDWIDAVIYEDLPRKEWFVFAVEANHKHGLHLSKAERKGAARRLIETTDMDLVEIARLCGFNRHTVGIWKDEIEASRSGVSDGRSATRHPPPRRRRKGEAGASARAYQEANPGASKPQVAKATGASEATVSRGRRLARTDDEAPQEATAAASTRPQPTEAVLPDDDAPMRLTDLAVNMFVRPVNDLATSLKRGGMPKRMAVAADDWEAFTESMRFLTEDYFPRFVKEGK
jgi:ParB-like chromosome segregation protein Spo0J